MCIDIEAENLTKVFGQHRALRAVNPKLHPGELLTIIGPNGAAKTTLLRCLSRRGWSAPLKAYLTKVAIILWKDPLAELRTGEMLSSMLVFVLLVTVVFNFTFDRKAAEMKELAPGLLWVAFTFAGILGLNRSFALEKDRNSLQALMLAPLDRSSIYVAKMLGNLIFLSIVEAIVVPLFWVLCNMSGFPWPLALIIPLATVGFVAAGTLFSAMTVGRRAREALLPVLLLPVSVPLIVAAAKATGIVLTQDSVADATGWIRLLVAFGVVFFVLSILRFEYVLEE